MRTDMKQPLVCFPHLQMMHFSLGSRKYPQVRLQTSDLKNGYGWNVKPQAIMQMIHNGFDEVVSGLTRNILLVAEHTRPRALGPECPSCTIIGPSNRKSSPLRRELRRQVWL
jgi:hypothetical protein